MKEGFTKKILSKEGFAKKTLNQDSVTGKKKLRLITPAAEMKVAAEEYKKEFLENGEDRIHGSCGLARFEKFEEWLEYIENTASGFTPGRLPSSTFFAFAFPENRIVGIANVRHYLDEAARKNGHVGYSVRPSERRKGYGTEILRLAVQKSYEFGTMEALVSCEKNNAASRRVIRRNGFEKIEEIKEENGDTIWLYSKMI